VLRPAYSEESLRSYIGFEHTAVFSFSFTPGPWLGLILPDAQRQTMLDELTPTCGADGCDRELRERDRMLAYRTESGERRAYECACGAVTVTVHR
jgi:hypothetical protein